MRTLTLKKYNYRGPGTKLEYGLNWNDPNITNPINNLDAICQRHDITYSKVQSLKDTHIGGSPIGFFNPVIPTQDFEQSRYPEGYFWHPTARAYFQSRIPLWFCCKIPNPELQIREIPYPGKPIGDPHIADYTMLDETSKRSYKPITSNSWHYRCLRSVCCRSIVFLVVV